MYETERVVKGLYKIARFLTERLKYKYAKDFLRTIDETIALLNTQQEQIDKLIEENASNAEMAEGFAELLKEQEAVEPRNTYSTTPSGKVIPHIFCGKCNKEIYTIYEFCPFCGQAVKWNE